LRWALGYFHAWSARLAAVRGDRDAALAHLALVVDRLERTPAWAGDLTTIAGHAAEVLWLLDRTVEAGAIEAAVRHKLIEPDFRGPGVDPRLTIARLCALTGRADEARGWFATARDVLAQRGCNPEVAIADLDEARMYALAGRPGERSQAGALLDSARRQFDALGMTGWLRRADEVGALLG
jgi:hypothetical protein